MSLGEFIPQRCVAYGKLMSNIYVLQEMRSDAKLGKLTSLLDLFLFFLPTKCGIPLAREGDGLLEATSWYY